MNSLFFETYDYYVILDPKSLDCIILCLDDCGWSIAVSFIRIERESDWEIVK